MLVISRRKGEQILVGGDVLLTIVRVRGNQVRVGIDAPPSVPIVRVELPPQPPQPPTEDQSHVGNEGAEKRAA